MEKAVWKADDLGINFAISYGRITIFQTTMKELGFPLYYRFLLDQENRQFAKRLLIFLRSFRKFRSGLAGYFYTLIMYSFLNAAVLTENRFLMPEKWKNPLKPRKIAVYRLCS